MKALAAAAALSAFPIGIYGGGEARYLRDLKAAGFDTVLSSLEPSGAEEVAAEAERLGLRLIPTRGELKNFPRGRTSSWPVLAWYIQDEPEVNHVSPEALSAISGEIRGQDPRPQAFCVGRGAKAKPYAGIGDVLMLDYYPVPYKAPDSVADQIDAARAVLPAGKPLWMVLQAYDWNDEPAFQERGIKTGRFPDHAELRFMSYLSVLHGARGLFYFQFAKPGGRTLLDYPEQWQAVSRVARELSLIKPVFEKGRREPLPFPPDPAGPEARAWRRLGRDYVVILNRRKDVMQKVPEELLAGGWRPLFEVRRDPRELLEKVGEAWYLRPYQVLVLESGRRWF